MASPKIGVVIPMFNAARFLPEAIASIRSQTAMQPDIVVVDDHSTDDSVQIARRLGVTVIQQQTNQGPASARNVGVAALPEEINIVAFLDADDMWTPEHLSSVIPLFDVPEVVLAHGRGSLLGQQIPMPGDFGDSVPADIFERLLVSNIVPQSGAVVRRDSFVRAGGYRPGARYAEDYELWLRLASIGLVASAGRVTVLYRRHDQNASLNTSRLLRGTIEARTHGLDWALAQGRRVEEARLAELDRRFVGEEIARLVYGGDKSRVRVLLETLPPDSVGGEFVRDWWRRNRIRWPWIALKAIIRPVLRSDS